METIQENNEDLIEPNTNKELNNFGNDKNYDAIYLETDKVIES